MAKHLNNTHTTVGSVLLKESTAEKHIRRNKELETLKAPWNIHYQALAEIFFTRKQNFTSDITPGEFLNEDVFDNTGQVSAFLFASLFLSMMFPDAERTFTLKPVRRLKDVKGIEEFFDFATEELWAAMGNPKAGLQSALMEYFLDLGVFGTAGVAEMEGPDDDFSMPLVFSAWGIKSMTIIENAQGFIDTIYFLRKRTVRQILEEFSEDGKVAEKILEFARDGKWDEKFDVLLGIFPKEPEKGKEGVAAMPFGTVHIDVQNKFVMMEGGHHEMPVMVGRQFKTMGEPLGRSSGMLALPDAASSNVLSEAVLVATEKQLDPPLGLIDSGRLGGGVVDTSASALTVFNSSGRIGDQNPIFPLFTVGELQSAEKMLDRLERKVTQAFFLDRLLDLNNDVQMTAFETSVRNRMRGEALGSLFSRQITEVFDPLIIRGFNILWRRGNLGIIETGIGAEVRKLWEKITSSGVVQVPKELAEAIEAGLDVFEVDYISPAKRFMRSEKLQGIFTASDAIMALEAVIPGISDNVDGDKVAEDIWELSGAPRRGFRTREDVAKFREAQNAQRQGQDQLAAAETASKIGVNIAQAQATLGTRGGAKQ